MSEVWKIYGKTKNSNTNYSLTYWEGTIRGRRKESARGRHVLRVGEGGGWQGRRNRRVSRKYVRKEIGMRGKKRMRGREVREWERGRVKNREGEEWRWGEGKRRRGI